VTEDVTPFKLDVTQGNYFFSENNFLPLGTSSINLTQYYQSASVWARYTSSVVPNNVYTSGSALVPMSASYYTKHTVYLVGDGADEEYFLIVNNNQYATLVETEGASLPTTPTYFNDGVVPLAAVYVQSGSANITQIQDIRPIIGFRAAGVNASSIHGNLLGLTADDHLQYLRVDGFRQMSGDLGLGGNDLYNANSISASILRTPSAIITNIQATSITGSLFGNATSATTSITSSYVISASVAISSSVSISSSFATTASYARNAQTASYVLQAVSASYAVTSSYALNTDVTQTITFVVGGTTTVTTGTKNNTRVISPYTGTITGWKLITDASSTVTLDIWKSTGIPTNTNSITGTAKPSLTTAQFATSSILTGWTTAVSENDIFIMEVESNSNASYINLTLIIS
jgi:hypothetical protein